MKIKKIMLVTFMLLTILMIGAVSASDNNFTDTLTAENSDEVSLDASIDEKVISEGSDNIIASSDDEIISDENSTKVSTNIDVVVNDVYEEEQVEINISITPSYATGRVDVIAGDARYNIEIENGACQAFIPPALNAGTYNVIVLYLGDENCLPCNATTTFQVLLADNDENATVVDDPGSNDEIYLLWINTEDSFSTAPEELGTIFATVIPGTIQGTVVMNYNGEDIYGLALSDFDEGRIDRERNIYNIALEVNGDFIFENLRNGDSFRFAFLDEEDNEVRGQDYFIYFGDNTVRFEVDAHNPGDHVQIDVSNENLSCDEDNDFVWINLPSYITEGKVIVTNGVYNLFEESVNFEEGSHWWKEIDDHYVCSFAPNSLDLDNVYTGDTVIFAFLDNDENIIASKDYRFSFIDENTINFRENQHINVNVWNEDDERGVLYTDCDEDVVSVDVPRGFEGTIYVFINDDEIADWNIEFNDEDDSSYHDWNLESLEISEAGEYNIVVKHDGEILTNQTINVVDFENDAFRVVVDYDSNKFRLYCPENSTGTVRIVTKNGEEEVISDDIKHEISFDDYNQWIEWSFDELNIVDEGDYHVDITVDETFSYGKWLYFDGNNGEDNELHIDIWDENDQRGVLYTDAQGNVLSIDAPRDYEGALFHIYVNGTKIDSCEAEFDGE